MRKIWPFTFYLLFYAANASYLPFYVLYFQGLGFSGAQVGLLTAVFPLISMISSPFWTGTADATHRHKLVMSISIAAAVVCSSLFPFARTILPILVLILLFSFFVAPITPLADTATMSMLGDEKHMYGRVRLGGTIGWGAAAPLASMLVERSGIQWAFWVYAMLMFLNLLVSRKFVFTRSTGETPFRHGIRALFRNRRFVLFLVAAFACGLATSSVGIYLFAYMEQLGIRRAYMGLALTISTISELPVLFFANRLLGRLKPHGLLVLAMIVTCIRLFFLVIFDTLAGILAFQLISGLTFPALWVAGVSYVNESAPPGLSATAQGIFSAAVFGFGAAGGGFLGGLLMERIGGGGMYTTIGVILFLTLVMYLILERRLPAGQHAQSL